MSAATVGQHKQPAVAADLLWRAGLRVTYEVFIGYKQPAVAADLLWRAGLRVTYEVFILSAHLSRVRKLGKLKFEHGSSRKSLAARIAPDRIERNSSMTL